MTRVSEPVSSSDLLVIECTGGIPWRSFQMNAENTNETGLPRETPVEPWKYLVARRHPWRKQLFLKGRNMTVRQLVGTVKANKFSEEQAAKDLRLPVEAIREALAYFEANPEVIELDAAYERYLLKLRGNGRGPQSVP